MLKNTFTALAFFILGMALVSFIYVSGTVAQTGETEMTEEDGRQQALKDANNSKMSAYQQAEKLDPSDYKTWKSKFQEMDLEQVAFSNNIRGCSQKLAFKNMMIMQYQEGAMPTDMGGSKIIQDFVGDQYKTIREKGVDQATQDVMNEYQSCMANAEPLDDPSKQYDMEMRYGACGKLNTIIADTLTSIERRQDIDRVLNRYDGKTPDLSETAFGRTEDPVPLLVGKLYQEADKNGFNSAVRMGSKLTLACYM